MSNTIYKFHEDPGHGWLEVPYNELVQLGIEKQISRFSYHNRKSVFLEEDLDLSTFIEAKLLKDGIITTYEKEKRSFFEKPEYEAWQDQFWSSVDKINYDDIAPLRNYSSYRN